MGHAPLALHAPAVATVPRVAELAVFAGRNRFPDLSAAGFWFFTKFCGLGGERQEKTPGWKHAIKFSPSLKSDCYKRLYINDSNTVIRNLKLALLAIGCSLTSSACYATALEARTEIASMPFHALTPIKVHVTGIRDKSLESEIKTKAELEIRKAHIEVTDDPELAQLFIDIFILSMPSTIQGGGKIGYIYAQHIDAFTHTIITNNRNPSMGTIWSSENNIGTTPNEGLYSTIKDNVEEQLNEFLNEYLKANPR